RGRRARRSDAQDLREVRLHQVRVVGRPRGHRQDGAGARVERHRRAALAGELLHRHVLGLRLDRQPEVVARDRLAAESVEQAVDYRLQARVRAGQVVVFRLFEPGAGARLGRVADDGRIEPALRVTAEGERLPADVLAVVGGEDLAVGGADLPALDRELFDDLDRVVLLVREPGRGPGLLVGRATGLR